MARYDPEPNVTISVLDRLIDMEPKVSTEALQNRAHSLRQLKASLRRDLEWLLNTRRTPDAVSEMEATQLKSSLYNYGLPDISSLGVHSSQDQNRLLWMMETAVTHFEPRIQGARVTLEPLEGNSKIMRFQIHGMLRIDPAPERVTFDTVLELTKGEYEVKGE